MREQTNSEIHFLVKPQFKDLVLYNPNISEVHVFDQLPSLVEKLKMLNFDYIIDLQKNRRSIQLSKKLNCQTSTFNKLNLKKWLLVQTGINLLPKKHIVDRYFESVKFLNVKSDGKPCEFYSNNEQESSGLLPKSPYIAFAVGAAHYGKRLTKIQLEQIIELSEFDIVFLGNESDDKILSQIKLNSKCHNLCGKTSLSELGFIIKNSAGVISGDTGIMHIASCYTTPQVSVWGCTKPSLGMSPYLKPNHMALFNGERPCSKLGNKCKNHPITCISKHSSTSIYSSIVSLINE